MPTITQKEYKNIIFRSMLKRWERISRNLDMGKGRSFSSAIEMKKWLRKL